MASIIGALMPSIANGGMASIIGALMPAMASVAYTPSSEHSCLPLRQQDTFPSLAHSACHRFWWHIIHHGVMPPIASADTFPSLAHSCLPSPSAAWPPSWERSCGHSFWWHILHHRSAHAIASARHISIMGALIPAIASGGI